MTKGISPMLSAVLLIVIAVAASVVVSSWVSSISEEQASNIQNTTQTKLGCQFADMFIKNVTYNCNNDCSAGTAHNTTLFITNSGKKTLRINNIAIQNTTGSIFSLVTNEDIAVGDTIRVSNVSSETCNGINNSIEDVIVTSPTCPETASDRFPGTEVIFLNC